MSIQNDVREALSTVGIEVPEGLDVHVTDEESGAVAGAYLVTLGQLDAAIDQYRQVTGEDLGDTDDIASQLGWN